MISKLLPFRFAGIYLLLSFFSSVAFCSAPLFTEPVAPVTKISSVKAATVIKFTAAQYAQMTGKRMTLRQRLRFNVLKIKLRKEVKENPDLLLSDFYKDNKKMAAGWVILIVVLCILLAGLLVAAIAYGNG